MIIGFVSEYFPPFAPGGAEWSTLYLAQSLARSERVIVLTPNYGAPPQETMDGVLVERFAFPVKLRSPQAMAPYGWHANLVFYLYATALIALAVKKHRLDILHVQHKHTLVGTVLAGMITHTPVVASLRDGMVLCRYGMCLGDIEVHPDCDWRTYTRCLSDYLALYQPGLRPTQRLLRRVMALYHRLDSHLKRLALRRADAIVTNSLKLRQVYASRGIQSEIFVTLDNPAPALADHPPAPGKHGDEIHILYAGKLSWGKGVHLLIEALPSVYRTLTPAKPRVTIAGQGPLEGQLRQRVVALGLSGHVHFAGQIAHTALQELYAQVDLVVVPSIVQEGFGRVALEALLSGTPVVVSNRGGLPEIVEHGVTGYVVEPEPEAIASAVTRALQTTHLRQQLREAWPALRSRFGVEAAERYRQLYRQVLNRRSGQEQPL